MAILVPVRMIEQNDDHVVYAYLDSGPGNTVLGTITLLKSNQRIMFIEPAQGKEPSLCDLTWDELVEVPGYFYAKRGLRAVLRDFESTGEWPSETDYRA